MYEEKDIKKVNPSRGKCHDYLGMDIDYSKPGIFKVLMTKYIQSMIDKFPYPEELKTKSAKSPAAEHLFNINPKGKPLDKAKKECFHTWVAKGLFLCKQSRPDIQPAIPFLCSRVNYPDEDDWKKLLRVLAYLRDTKDIPLQLEGDIHMTHNKWYADASFATHPDLRSHTGGVMTMGKGGV